MTDSLFKWSDGLPVGGGDMEKSVYDTDNDGKVDTAEMADRAAEADHATTADSVPWSGVTGKPTTFAPSAHSHTGLIYGFDPPIQIYGGRSITAGTHNIYLPDYGVSGYSWVFVIVGGRSDPVGSYMHVRKYGTEEWFVACANLSTVHNVFVSGWCPVASNRIALYASASIGAVHLRITAAKI